MLQHYCGVHWHLLPVAGESRAARFAIDGFPRLQFEAVAVPGKAPPYSTPRSDATAGEHIALRVHDTDSGGRLFFAPSLARVGADELEAMRDADCLLVDGSFWSDDEMIAAGLGRTARQRHGPSAAVRRPGRHAGDDRRSSPGSARRASC